MYFIGVDLGSTNIKAAVYESPMRLVDRQSLPVQYIRENGFVEFDADRYAADLEKLIGGMLKENNIAPAEVRQIVFTGQAESLVVLDAEGRTLRNAISWMDERSVEECAEVEKRFTAKEIESVTGQLAVLPTWPATKIMWLKKHEPEVYAKAATYLLIKDFIVYHLTGRLLADCSIATFSLYFDIYEKNLHLYPYLPPMLAGGLRFGKHYPSF